MADRIVLETDLVERQVADLIAAYPELDEDEALRADMLEGSTDLHSLLSRIVDHRQEARAYQDILKQQMDEKSERRAHYSRREEAMNALALRLLNAAGVEKVTLPEATISITKARESVMVTDPDALPQGYFATVRQPDKKAIGEALKRGEEIPGAALKFGEAGLMVRTK